MSSTIVRRHKIDSTIGRPFLYSTELSQLVSGLTPTHTTVQTSTKRATLFDNAVRDYHLPSMMGEIVTYEEFDLGIEPSYIGFIGTLYEPIMDNLLGDQIWFNKIRLIESDNEADKDSINDDVIVIQKLPQGRYRLHWKIYGQLYQKNILEKDKFLDKFKFTAKSQDLTDHGIIRDIIKKYNCVKDEEDRASAFVKALQARAGTPSFVEDWFSRSEEDRKKFPAKVGVLRKTLPKIPTTRFTDILLFIVMLQWLVVPIRLLCTNYLLKVMNLTTKYYHPVTRAIGWTLTSIVLVGTAVPVFIEKLYDYTRMILGSALLGPLWDTWTDRYEYEQWQKDPWYQNIQTVIRKFISSVTLERVVLHVLTDISSLFSHLGAIFNQPTRRFWTWMTDDKLDMGLRILAGIAWFLSLVTVYPLAQLLCHIGNAVRYVKELFSGVVNLAIGILTLDPSRCLESLKTIGRSIFSLIPVGLIVGAYFFPVFGPVFGAIAAPFIAKGFSLVGLAISYYVTTGLAVAAQAISGACNTAIDRVKRKWIDYKEVQQRAKEKPNAASKKASPAEDTDPQKDPKKDKNKRPQLTQTSKFDKDDEKTAAEKTPVVDPAQQPPLTQPAAVTFPSIIRPASPDESSAQDSTTAPRIVIPKLSAPSTGELKSVVGQDSPPSPPAADSPPSSPSPTQPRFDSPLSPSPSESSNSSASTGASGKAQESRLHSVTFHRNQAKLSHNPHALLSDPKKPVVFHMRKEKRELAKTLAAGILGIEIKRADSKATEAEGEAKRGPEAPGLNAA